MILMLAAFDFKYTLFWLFGLTPGLRFLCVSHICNDFSGYGGWSSSPDNTSGYHLVICNVRWVTWSLDDLSIFVESDDQEKVADVTFQFLHHILLLDRFILQTQAFWSGIISAEVKWHHRQLEPLHFPLPCFPPQQLRCPCEYGMRRNFDNKLAKLSHLKKESA